MDTEVQKRMEQWCKEIDGLTIQFKERFVCLSKDELNWKPHSRKWSIGQIMDHLIIINSTYFPIIESLKAGTYQRPFVGRFGFMVRFFGSFILKSVEPSRKRKLKTFPIWEPSFSQVPVDILKQFEEVQGQLKEKIRESASFIAGDVVIASPASRMAVYTLSRAFEIIITHENRHFNQAVEVLTLMKSSQSN